MVHCLRRSRCYLGHRWNLCPSRKLGHPSTGCLSSQTQTGRVETRKLCSFRREDENEEPPLFLRGTSRGAGHCPLRSPRLLPAASQPTARRPSNVVCGVPTGHRRLASQSGRLEAGSCKRLDACIPREPFAHSWPFPPLPRHLP